MTIESLVINFPYTQHSILVFFKKNRNLYNAIRGITKQHGFVTTTEGTTEIEERNIKKRRLQDAEKHCGPQWACN